MTASTWKKRSRYLIDHIIELKIDARIIDCPFESLFVCCTRENPLRNHVHKAFLFKFQFSNLYRLQIDICCHRLISSLLYIERSPKFTQLQIDILRAVASWSRSKIAKNLQSKWALFLSMITWRISGWEHWRRPTIGPDWSTITRSNYEGLALPARIILRVASALVCRWVRERTGHKMLHFSLGQECPRLVPLRHWRPLTLHHKVFVLLICRLLLENLV